VVAGLLLLTGCGDDDGDTGIDGDAPAADDEAPLDPDPETQEAPNAEDPDLSGDEEPALEPSEEVDGETGG
jgi:hypothetical protein